MKRLLLATMAAIAISAPVQAADMPVKAAPAVVAAAYNWRGCYVGVHGGWGRQTSDNSFSGLAGPPFFAEENVDGSGALFGGHTGCNWQNGRFVYGIEGDAQWTNIRGDDANVGGDTNELHLRWIATARGRIGYTFFSDRWLSYITGGFAAAGANSNVLNPGRQETVSRTITGWTLGWGSELAFTNNLSGRLETRYYWFGQEDFRHVNYVERINDLRVWTITVGLTYRFSGPLF